MSAVEQLCRKAIVLQQGELAFIGSSQEAIAYYISSVYETEKLPLPMSSISWTLLEEPRDVVLY